IVRDGLEEASGYVLYVTSVYWSVTTLSTVGYGDIFASSIAERSYCVVVMLAGATMYALAISALSHIITTLAVRHTNAKRIERQAKVFSCVHSFPKDLYEEIVQAVNHTGETEETLRKDSQQILELLPPVVRTRALFYIYDKQVC
ncbi:unnamed protein product, partial [Choristocarpus tenellus]